MSSTVFSSLISESSIGYDAVATIPALGSPENILEAAFYIPTSAVGLLIGKSGATLKMIMDRSGAKVRFQNSHDMIIGARERGITITGSKKQMQEALRIIFLKLQAHAPSSSPQFHTADRNDISTHSGEVQLAPEAENEPLVIIQWAIPQAATGMLIGKQGLRIKYINDVSGAWVKIAHPEESSLGDDERRVYIRGTRAQTDAALTIVRDLAGGRPLTDIIKEDRTDVFIPRRSTKAILLKTPGTELYAPHESNQLTSIEEKNARRRFRRAN